jgi:membrane protein implicated in regulation of membrane protease activity
MTGIGNQTVVHGLLTTILGLGYAAVVVFLASFLSILGQGSGLAVSISTLVVAALLWPAWRRTQDAVNRRFNRRRVRTG